MKVYDNFNLKSKSNGEVDNWLELIIKKLISASKHDFTLRLYGERKTRSIVYTLENTENKTKAIISKKGETIRIELFSRQLPDPEKYIKPDYKLISAYLFNRSPAGLEEAATAISLVLDEHTPYSLKEVVKAKVYSLANSKDPWSFYGGIIHEVQYFDGFCTIAINNHKLLKQINNPLEMKPMPNVGTYAIFNQQDKVEVVGTEEEFNYYFKQVENA
jgi:hypothetical protein